MFSEWCAGCLNPENCWECGSCLKTAMVKEYDDNISTVLSDLTDEEKRSDSIMGIDWDGITA